MKIMASNEINISYNESSNNENNGILMTSSM
jgi:nitrous oxidase accessory protein NosD